MEEPIIHVLMLKQSATQKPTKFHGPQTLRATSTGFRSSLISLRRKIVSGCRPAGEIEGHTMSWPVDSPGSVSLTASLLAQYLAFEPEARWRI